MRRATSGSEAAAGRAPHPIRPSGAGLGRRRRLPTRAKAAVAVAAAACAAAGLFIVRNNGAGALPRSSSQNGRDEAAALELVSLSEEPAALFDEEDRDLLAQALSRRERLRGKGWHICSAWEGGVCHCVGTAMLHTWLADWAMVRHANGSIRCSLDAFDGDPRPHFPKLCSCLSGPAWPQAVLEGLNETIARHLVPRVEIGPAGAGCGPEDDALWTPCAVMSTRYDASIIPERYLPRLGPSEQEDVALRKLDLCHQIAGPDMSMRLLGIWSPKDPPSSPVKAQSASTCAVVYDPEQGPEWEGRAAVFCPTDPRHCLEGSCECADSGRVLVDVHLGKDGRECWACVTPAEQKRLQGEEANADEGDPRGAKGRSLGSSAAQKQPASSSVARPQVSPAAAAATEAR